MESVRTVSVAAALALLAGCFGDPPSVDEGGSSGPTSAATTQSGDTTTSTGDTSAESKSESSTSTAPKSFCDDPPTDAVLCADFDDGVIPWEPMDSGGPIAVDAPPVDPPSPPNALRTELVGGGGGDALSRVRVAADSSWPTHFEVRFQILLPDPCEAVRVLQLGYPGARDISLRLSADSGELIADGGDGPQPFVFTPPESMFGRWIAIALRVREGATATVEIDGAVAVNEVTLPAGLSTLEQLQVGLRGDGGTLCVAWYDDVLVAPG